MFNFHIYDYRKEEKMKKNQLRLFIIACLIITVCAFGYVTYAFYQSQFSGTASATLVAKWNFDFLGKDATEFKSLKGGTYTIDLGNTCTNCVNTGDTQNPVYKLQPGSKGSFSIKVDSSSSKVKTTAKVTMYSLSMGGSNSFPDGLKFYVVNDGIKSELSLASLATADGVSVFDNTWTADEEKIAEKTIEWEWLYATGNDNAYQGKTITFGLKAIAEQITE